MKKKKVNKNENEWKGILQETQSNISTESVTSTNVRSYEEKANALQEHLKINPNKPFYWETPGSDYDVDKLILEAENEEPILYDVERAKKFKELNPNFKVKELFKNYNKNNIYEWDNFTKDKTLSEEEEHCNVGVNKDWDIIELRNHRGSIYSLVKKKKRINFEFTPLTFWQLTPSIAVNLSMKEIELTWLCFGAYINFKRNG